MKCHIPINFTSWVFTFNFSPRILLKIYFHTLTKSYYRPQRSCGQGYVFTRVCDSVNRGGLRRTLLGPRRTPPPGPRRTPPAPGRPPGTKENPPPCTRQTPPPPEEQQHTVNERPVCILLECILVFKSFVFDKNLSLSWSGTV